MSTVILLGILLISEVFSLLLMRLYKKTPLLICSIILGILLIISTVMLFCRVQFEPFVFGCVLGFTVLCEYFCILSAFNKKEVSLLCTVMLTVFAVAFLLFHQSCIYKDFDGKEYAGVYSALTGSGETKVTYYEKHGPLV